MLLLSPRAFSTNALMRLSSLSCRRVATAAIHCIAVAAAAVDIITRACGRPCEWAWLPLPPWPLCRTWRPPPRPQREHVLSRGAPRRWIALTAPPASAALAARSSDGIDGLPQGKSLERHTLRIAFVLAHAECLVVMPIEVSQLAGFVRSPAESRPCRVGELLDHGLVHRAAINRDHARIRDVPFAGHAHEFLHGGGGNLRTVRLQNAVVPGCGRSRRCCCRGRGRVAVAAVAVVPGSWLLPWPSSHGRRRQGVAECPVAVLLAAIVLTATAQSLKHKK